MGLAATDTPASLGTEALQFSARTDDAYAKALKAELDSRKQHETCLFSAAFETRFEFADEAPPAADTADSIVSKIFARFGQTEKTPEPKTPSTPAAPNVAGDVAQLATAFRDGMKELGQSFNQALGQANAASNARFAKLESEYAALKTAVEGTPDRNYVARPLAAGGDGVEQTDC